MSNFKLWITIGIILTLITGFMLGMIAGKLIYSKHKRAYKEWMTQGMIHERLLARLSRKLDLTQSQIQAIGGVLRLEAVKIDDAKNQFRSKIKAVKDETLQKILPHLTPEQQEKYQKLVESHRKRWEKICASE